MTLLMYIFILVIGSSAIDFLLKGHERVQDIVYKITFFGVWFLFVIRYYYGPDIFNYVPFYEGLRPWTWYLRHPEHYEYEHGFVLFCAILKGLGLSYYWMTAIVTTFYFAMVALLFRRIKRHRTMALMILVLFDYGMIVAMHRQCLSISFFLLMILLMDKKKLLWSLLCAFLVVEMHKSGIFIVSLTWLFYLLHQYQQERVFFVIALALLCLMLVIPLSSVSTSFIHSLPLPDSFIKSLELHFTLGRQFQVIWIIYASCILFMAYSLQQHTESKRATEAAVMVCVTFIVVFYHYFYLLERLRSYFLPLLLAYLCRFKEVIVVEIVTPTVYVHGVTLRQHHFLNLGNYHFGNVNGIEALCVQTETDVGAGLLFQESGGSTIRTHHNFSAADILVLFEHRTVGCQDRKSVV